jgi:hypothetical protein
LLGILSMQPSRIMLSRDLPTKPDVDASDVPD